MFPELEREDIDCQSITDLLGEDRSNEYGSHDRVYLSGVGIVEVPECWDEERRHNAYSEVRESSSQPYPL